MWAPTADVGDTGAREASWGTARCFTASACFQLKEILFSRCLVSTETYLEGVPSLDVTLLAPSAPDKLEHCERSRRPTAAL